MHVAGGLVACASDSEAEDGQEAAIPDDDAAAKAALSKIAAGTDSSKAAATRKRASKEDIAKAIIGHMGDDLGPFAAALRQFDASASTSSSTGTEQIVGEKLKAPQKESETTPPEPSQPSEKKDEKAHQIEQLNSQLSDMTSDTMKLRVEMARLKAEMTALQDLKVAAAAATAAQSAANVVIAKPTTDAAAKKEQPTAEKAPATLPVAKETVETKEHPIAELPATLPVTKEAVAMKKPAAPVALPVTKELAGDVVAPQVAKADVALDGIVSDSVVKAMAINEKSHEQDLSPAPAAKAEPVRRKAVFTPRADLPNHSAKAEVPEIKERSLSPLRRPTKASESSNPLEFEIWADPPGAPKSVASCQQDASVEKTTKKNRKHFVVLLQKTGEISGATTYDMAETLLGGTPAWDSIDEQTRKKCFHAFVDQLKLQEESCPLEPLQATQAEQSAALKSDVKEENTILSQFMTEIKYGAPPGKFVSESKTASVPTKAKNMFDVPAIASRAGKNVSTDVSEKPKADRRKEAGSKRRKVEGKLMFDWGEADDNSENVASANSTVFDFEWGKPGVKRALAEEKSSNAANPAKKATLTRAPGSKTDKEGSKTSRRSFIGGA